MTNDNTKAMTLEHVRDVLRKLGGKITYVDGYKAIDGNTMADAIDAHLDPREVSDEKLLPVVIYGKVYDVPIPVQLHIVSLTMQLEEAKQSAPRVVTDEPSFERWYWSQIQNPLAPAYNNPLGIPTDGNLHSAAKWGWDACRKSFATSLPAARVPDGWKPLGYFAADPAEGEFETFRTLQEAREKADGMLEWAADSAADWGWADDPPQICYGVVLGGCEEESREPAPEGSEFREVVSFRIFGPTTAASDADAEGKGNG